MFVDFQQYLLTAATLVPSTLISYAVLYWLAKFTARALGGFFGLSILGHIVYVLIACALAPVVALWLIDRPADLLDESGRALWAGAIGAFIVIAAAQEYGPSATTAQAPYGRIRRVISGAAVGGVAGAIAFVLFAILLAKNPKSQVEFGFGSFPFFVIAGLLIGAIFLRRRVPRAA